MCVCVCVCVCVGGWVCVGVCVWVCVCVFLLTPFLSSLILSNQQIYDF